LYEVPTAHAEATVAAAPPRRVREFRLLLTGSSVSMLGSRVSAIAYPLLVLALTDSPVAAGWACFAATAPSVLFYLPAGAFIDRSNPRHALLTCESLRGLAIASLVVALAVGRLTVTQLILVAIVEEILEVFSTLAERRIARSLVEPGDAASALAQSEARSHIVVMLGRPIGAVLFSIGHALPFLADALTFGVNIAAVRRIRNNRGDYSEPVENSHLLRDIGAGFDWLREHSFAGHALLRTAGTTFIFQALVIIFLGEAYEQHLSSAEIGFVLAASGLGGVLGSAVAAKLFNTFGYSLFKKQLTIWMLIFVVLALDGGGRSIIALAIAMSILGLTGALGNIALDTYTIQNAAEAILGRVLSVGRLTSFAALALGPLLGGFLVKEFGAQVGIVVLLIAAILLRIAAPSQPPAQAKPLQSELADIRPAAD